jgi:hypothetical protein
VPAAYAYTQDVLILRGYEMICSADDLGNKGEKV